MQRWEVKKEDLITQKIRGQLVLSKQHGRHSKKDHASPTGERTNSQIQRSSDFYMSILACAHMGTHT